MRKAFDARFLAAVLLAAVAAWGCGETDGEEAARCWDGERNGLESDLDCGGSCPPCRVGRACAGDADCTTSSCQGGLCADATCADTRKNGLETDVDCGGGCPGCGVGRTCGVDDDCGSGRCTGAVCEAAPSCSDGARNGTETDVDCGGGACGPCALDRACGEHGDCVSERCEGGRCVPSCENGRVDGDESDIDCGGSCQQRCAEGRHCNGDADCLNGRCNDSGICEAEVSASCTDEVQNGGETDVDCGGGTCPRCDFGLACLVDEDCESGTFLDTECHGGMCGGLGICADGEQNGHETAVDCGGRFCSKCRGGQACRSGDDCFSGECAAGICTDPPDTCDNDVKDGYEADVDCGGPCPGCPDGWACTWGSDCEYTYCDAGMCGGDFMCFDGERDGKETDTDCGGGLCLPCRGGQACGEDEDCGSGRCEALACADEGPECRNEVQDGTETDVDCGGRGCLPCGEGRACLEGSDCGTGFCVRETCSLSVVSLQSAAASTACSASGTVTVAPSVTLLQLVVASGRFELDATTDGYYLQQDSRTWTDWPAVNTGIVLSVDRAVNPTLGVGDVIDVTAELREQDCETRLHVGPTGGVIARTGESLDLSVLEPPISALADGGTPDAEPYEGSLVLVSGVQVADTTGHDGPEGPGAPRWWIKVAPGIFVADDFGVGEKPATGTALAYVRGFLKYRHGVYLIVPRDAQDLRPADTGGRE